MRRDSGKLLYGDITDRIIRAYYDVFDALIFGIPEIAFQRAMFVAMREHGLQCVREVEMPVEYHGVVVGQFRADLVVENKVIVEIKSGPKILRTHETQLIGYLKISRLQVGLLLNFGPTPSFHRFFSDPELRTSRSASVTSFVSEKSEGS